MRAIKQCNALTPCVLLVNGDTYSKLQELSEHRLDGIINKAKPISELRNEILKVFEHHRSNAEIDTDEEVIES